MRKPAFLSNERLSRFLVSLLLTMGLLLPLMFTFEAESALALAIVSGVAVTVLCTVLGTLRRGRLILGVVLAALLAVQLALPQMGLIGWAMEAFKAISLYLSGVTAATRCLPSSWPLRWAWWWQPSATCFPRATSVFSPPPFWWC